MTKMIQLRNVPDELHRKLKSRAADAGMTLSDFILRETKLLADRPTNEEMLRRLRSLPPVKLKSSPAKIIREMRDR
jgi:plasmid stability protein